MSRATPPTARGVASAVLVRVAKDGAFAAAALDAEIERLPQLDPRDKGLATELVYGTLRVLPWLEDRVGRHAPRGLKSLDHDVRAELGIAAYQLYFLDRVPAFAAVSSAVDAVRRVKGPRVAGFVNAVLRKVGVDAAKVAPGERRATLEIATFESVDASLRAGLERALGAESARAFLLSGTEAPPTGLRVEDASARPEWLERLKGLAPAAAFTVGAVSPHAILARGAGKLERLAGWSDGKWSIQEEGSQLVALAVGATREERVLDACAGRGHKTALLAHTGARVDAADVHPSKLDALVRELERVGEHPGGLFAVDWTVGGGGVGAAYDAVLVDAPCSGVGTLRRRPELAVRAAKRPLGAIADVQLAIASKAAERVRPGGRLVYAVCSVLIEESDELVVRLLAAMPAFEPAPFAGAAAAKLAGDATTLRLLPHVHGTDGYFVASLRRKC